MTLNPVSLPRRISQVSHLPFRTQTPCLLNMSGQTARFLLSSKYHHNLVYLSRVNWLKFTRWFLLQSLA